MSTRILNDGNYVVNNTTNYVVLDIEEEKGHATSAVSYGYNATSTVSKAGTAAGSVAAVGSVEEEVS